MARTLIVPAALASTLVLTACGAADYGAESPPATPGVQRTTEIPLPTPVPIDEPAASDPALDEVVFTGEYPVDAGPAGSIVVTVSDGGVTLADLLLEPGWRQESLDEDGRDLEVELVSADSTVEVEVTADQRRFDTHVAIDQPVTAELEYPLGGVGTVVIAVEDGAVRVSSVNVPDDWEVRGGDSERSRSVDLRITNRDTRQEIRFNAETDDDRLDIDVTMRTRAIRIAHE